MRGFLVVMVVFGSLGVARGEPVKRWAATQPARRPIALMAPAPAPRRGVPRARVLHAQAMSAYQAGNYSSAVRTFAAALDAAPSPELLYHAAQAYRMKGDRAHALELYERYLVVAPDGPAAAVCTWYAERLRDAAP